MHHINKGIPHCPAEHSLIQKSHQSLAGGQSQNNKLIFLFAQFAHRYESIAAASHLPLHPGIIHVRQRDRERSLHPLGLHVHLPSLGVAQVNPPRIQGSNWFLETLKNKTGQRPSQTRTDHFIQLQSCRRVQLTETTPTSFRVPVSLLMATTPQMRICRQQVAPMHAPKAFPHCGYT